jgi:hypothetical protein
MSQYEFIEPLREKPTIEKRIYKTKSISQQVIEEFLQSNEKYATIRKEVVTNYKSPATCARGFGRVLKTLKLSEKIDVYSDKNNVYLERK